MPHSMMNSMFFTVALCLLAAISINAEQTASFYGSSFASLVLQDSSSGSGVDTRFRFKTRSEDALLLLAASGADYCIIELKRGTLKVRLKLASISKEFSLGGQERCNDLRWHEVMVFYKSGHNVSIALDQQYTTHQLPVASGALSSLDHPGQKTTIYVGSLGGYAGPLSTGRPPNFRGCLESLYYNNINVFHRVQANKKTSGGVLYELEFEHRCPTLFEASNSDAISFTDAQQSFIALPTLPDCSQGLQLNMQFQSSMSRGLLAYQSGRRSVLALELDDGRVNLLFKFGGELHTLTSPHRVTDAHWHKLQVELQANGSVVFYVDTNKITWDGERIRLRFR